MRWDVWISNKPDGTEEDAVLFIKHLLHLRGLRIDLHKITSPDSQGCFHSHPATAIRIILRGGYVEQVWEPRLWPRRRTHIWLPGDVGIIRPDYVHRIDSLLDGPSYSLWLRGPITHEIKTYGPGYAGLPSHVKEE